jgi:hypothetical protein
MTAQTLKHAAPGNLDLVLLSVSTRSSHPDQLKRNAPHEIPETSGEG